MKLEDKYINREISWLHFNGRVLQEAADEKVPLLERLRFLGIFSNNLDEFFRVRYATVKRKEQSEGEGEKTSDGFETTKLMKRITAIVIAQQSKSLDILAAIQKELEEHAIFFLREDQIQEQQVQFVKDYFLQKVSPALVTMILTDMEEMPSLKDSLAYLAVKMKMKATSGGAKRYILIEIPEGLERFVRIPSTNGKTYIMLLDDLIRYNLKSYFSIFDYESLSAHMIKITRDAQLDMRGGFNKSYIAELMSSVKSRVEGQLVRFVYDERIGKDTLQYLLSKMNIDDTDSIIPGGRYHNRRDYMDFPDLRTKALRYPVYAPLPIAGLQMEGSLFERIGEKDFLQYVPYHTFSYTVRLLREAAIDPQVKSIKITIYRLAEFSHISSSLINAVKNGKRVTVVIELQARFDEVNNVRYAEQMKREGVDVIFGVPGLKVHNKTCVISRQEKDELKRYGFISTGNLNENTAKTYTDYNLFTAHQGILRDVEKLFAFFETNYKVQRYQHLIVSPHYSRHYFEKLIDDEIANAKAGKKNGIRLKFNSLSDYKMIDKLYEASRAGVQVKLIVRGICCLIPGIPGMSEHIEAISIVDYYLEHPRLLIFENNGNPKIFISSADWMERNLDYRVEASCPIYQEDIRKELLDTFEICWNDNVKARDFTGGAINTYHTNECPRTRSQLATYNYYLKQLKET